MLLVSILNMASRAVGFQPVQWAAQWIDLMSIPACAISHNGLMSRSFWTASTMRSAAYSMSVSVVNRPKPIDRKSVV